MKLYLHDYRYLDYEKKLAMLEVKNKLQLKKIKINKNYIELSGDFKKTDIRELIYFSKAESNGRSIETLQSQLENNRVRTIRSPHGKQSTRYSVHGIHEYRGKFNPQIVRGILNIMNIPKKSQIIDPFCGSGTTLIECYYGGYNCIGLDKNPLASFISNSKIETLGLSPRYILKTGLEIINRSHKLIEENVELFSKEDERVIYLKKWFPEKYLYEFESLKIAIDRIPQKKKSIFYVIASNLLRNYSNQEPSDLRIRRRYSPYPKISIYESYKRDLEALVKKIEYSNRVTKKTNVDLAIYNIDSKSNEELSRVMPKKSVIDACVTSPPYAMALPYIDTQRLTLVWLKLCKPKEIKNLDQELIGSREYIKNQGEVWIEHMYDNTFNLPKRVHSYCMLLNSSVSKIDGFRRQAVPSLLYRYLFGMYEVFKNLHPYFKKDAWFALIVGHNSTTLGNKSFSIDTPRLLIDIAKSTGWYLNRYINLDTYQRYDIHSTNSINDESLVILRKK